jgi:HEAT repeat protein
LLLALLSGCGRSEPPLSGGKPVTYWVSALQDPDAKLRQKAVVKLGNVGPKDAAVLPALIDALKDADAAVRREAVLSLMKYGPDAKEAVPVLADMKLRDRDEEVRVFAGKALEKLSADE